jgi:hypothetical protein
LASCSKSKEDIAKSLIKENLKTTLNDFNSYEPVEFGKLDTSFSKLDLFNEEMELKKLNDKVDEIALNKYDLDRTIKDIQADKESLILIQKANDSISKLIENKKKNFKPQLAGFKMKHTLRAKNALGATILQTYTFYFSEDLTKVYNVEKE